MKQYENRKQGHRERNGYERAGSKINHERVPRKKKKKP